MTDDGKPSWATNLREHIAKSFLSFRAKFWWAILRLRLMPIEGDTHLDKHRAILVASLIVGLKIDFGQIIAEEIFVRAHRVSSVLPFSYLIMKLCRQANMPLI